MNNMKKENKKIPEFSQPCKAKNCQAKNSKNSHHCYFHGVIIENKHPNQHPARNER